MSNPPDKQVSHIRARWRARLVVISAVSLIALIFLCLVWELRLAPVYTGGSWLALKAAPLLLPLNGILKGHRRAFQLSALLILLYLMEGVVRASSDPPGLSRGLATAEILLSLVFYACAVAYARMTVRHGSHEAS